MKWTRNKPITEGFYWFRPVPSVEPYDVEVVSVWRQPAGGELVADISGYPMEVSLDKIEGEWAGPLEPPK